MDSFFIGFTFIVGIVLVILLATDYFVDNRFYVLMYKIKKLEEQYESLENKFKSSQSLKIQSLDSN